MLRYRLLSLLLAVSACGPSQREIARVNATARRFDLGPGGDGRRGLGAGALRRASDLTLPAGTRVVTVLDRSITSAGAGGPISSSVAFEVRGPGGRVAIPGGSRVDLVLIHPASAAEEGMPVTLKVAAVSVRGQRRGLAARVVSASQPIESQALAAAAAVPGRRVLVSGGSTILLELTAPFSLPED